MIELKPTPSVDFDCPECDETLEPLGWRMPGMRILAELQCARCGREFFGDLPSGHGLTYPSLLNQETGVVYNEFNGPWFSDWLRDSFQNKTTKRRKITIYENQSVDRPLILNCLDGFYGHSLLKLLNAQYHIDNHPDHDLVVIVPSNLTWIVPEGVDAIWEVDIPLSQGEEWNEYLASEFTELLSKYDEVSVSINLPHPHPEDYDIERFTGVAPFTLESWQQTDPTVTFIWRDDRTWGPDFQSPGLWRRVRGTLYSGTHYYGWNIGKYEQYLRVRRLARRLKRRWGALNFAVAGIGEPGGFPDWIDDLRTPSPSADDERALCEQYANSHVVVGVHGSNMLLPSGHAGGVVELVPPAKWGNYPQDILIGQEFDCREALLNIRSLPTSTDAKAVEDIVSSMIEFNPRLSFHMSRDWSTHERANDWASMREQWKQIRQMDKRNH